MSDQNKSYGKEEINKFADPKQWEVWPAPAGFEVLYQTFPEFTCLCPRSGYPDFAKVHLILIPEFKVLELKALKLWLNSFRQERISHENATHQILTTLAEELEIAYGFLLMEYTPRGNLTTFPMKEYYTTHEKVTKNSDFITSLDTALTIKQELIKKIINRQYPL